jgi:hypothetical protein
MLRSCIVGLLLLFFTPSVNAGERPSAPSAPLLSSPVVRDFQNVDHPKYPTRAKLGGRLGCAFADFRTLIELNHGGGWIQVHAQWRK